MNKRLRAQIDNARQQARELVRNRDMTGRLVSEAMDKAERYRNGPLTKVWDDLQALLRLLRNWLTGSYRQVPTQTLLMAIAAVVYFVNPFDLVTDFIPGAGMIDDVTLLVFVMQGLRADIDRFRAWEREASETPRGQGDCHADISDRQPSR